MSGLRKTRHAVVWFLLRPDTLHLRPLLPVLPVTGRLRKQISHWSKCLAIITRSGFTDCLS
jgi:hypothetical protein